MSFGIADAGVVSRTTTNTVEVASKDNEEGEIVEETSYGGVEEITEEVFTDSLTNEALNGQTGTTSSGIVIEHTLTESNTDYARASKRTRKPLAAGA